MKPAGSDEVDVSLRALNDTQTLVVLKVAMSTVKDDVDRIRKRLADRSVCRLVVRYLESRE